MAYHQVCNLCVVLQLFYTAVLRADPQSAPGHLHAGILLVTGRARSGTEHPHIFQVMNQNESSSIVHRWHIVIMSKRYTIKTVCFFIKNNGQCSVSGLECLTPNR